MRDAGQQLCELEPLWLLAIESGFYNMWREACEGQKPAHIGVRHALLRGKIGKGFRLAGLNPPPPAARSYEMFLMSRQS